LKLKVSIKKNKEKLCLLCLILILINHHLFMYEALASKELGLSKKDELAPDESEIYEFSNNVKFKIKTNVFLKIEIGYEDNIENREISLEIINKYPTSLEIVAKQNMENFGFSKNPNEPGNQENFEHYVYTYNCIYRIELNTTMEEIKLRFKKDFEYGLYPYIEYTFAVYEENGDSWKVLKTKEVSDDSDIYLESSLEDLEADTEYYITIYDVSILSYSWFWAILIISISVLSVVVLLSKKDYFHQLRTRSTPIQKGAHRLSLDEVLENENRNKIIDLILTEPGIHFNELMRRTGLAAGNLVWHLEILEIYKIIGKKAVGKYVVYFPYYQKNPISNIDLKLSKSKLTLELLEYIEKEPGIWSNLIAKRKVIHRKTVEYHLNKLKDLRLIIVKKVGRKKRLYPNFDSEYYKLINNKNKENNNEGNYSRKNSYGTKSTSDSYSS